MSAHSLGIFEIFRNNNKHIKAIGKSIGQGRSSIVRDILMTKDRKLAGKLIEKRKEQKSEEGKTDVILRGENFIYIKKIISSKIEGKNYDLILMEKAVLRDLGKLTRFFCFYNVLKIIYNPFDEVVGDNLLRFYSKQIITALELLDRNYYVHNDIKPENILITYGLTIKLTDFYLLRKVKDKQTRIPERSPGYSSPEYYINKEVNSETARKQDYFALGSTLYFFKYGKSLLKYKDNHDRIMIADEIVDLLEQKRDNIKLGKMSDEEFINFLCSLIQFKPEDRPCFEEIYRNIWLNKNTELINNICSTNLEREDKLIMELQKSDFLIKKEKDFNSENENRQKSKDNKFIKKDTVKKKKNNKLCRFRFKKRINN